MYRFFKKYAYTLVIIATIFYLSFFTPPQTKLDEITNFDKLVHTCMYGGLCLVMWFEYLRAHRTMCWRKIFWLAIVAPIAMSGAIELMQAYCTTTRSGDWWDFAANSLGVFLAACVGYFVLRPLVWRRKAVAQ
jgi:VanZ family protein